MRRARLSGRIGLEGISGIAECLWRKIAARLAARVAIAGANFYSGDKERYRTRSQHRYERMSPNFGQRNGRARSRLEFANLRRRARSRRATRDHRRGHEIRVWRCRWKIAPDRRMPHARLISVLAERSICPRTKSAELRQTIRARLSGDS